VNERRVRVFWSRVDKRGPDECWNWLGGKNKGGYGQLNDGTTMVLAHRYAWIIHNGEIPKGMLVLHRCNNRSCVNPNHLYVGDESDNHGDMIRAGNCVTAFPTRRKLYDEEIWLIRRLLTHGIRRILIAKMFKVSQNMIGKINRQSNFPSKGSANKET